MGGIDVNSIFKAVSFDWVQEYRRSTEQFGPGMGVSQKQRNLLFRSIDPDSALHHYSSLSNLYLYYLRHSVS